MSPGTSARSAGFTLVEALVAMVLISVTLLALAPVMFTAATRQVAESGTVERNTILQSEADRLSSLPIQALAAQSGCKTLPPQARFSHGLCIGVQPMGGGQTRVTVTVTSENPLVGPDSIVMTRRAGGQGSPFNTGGGP